MSVISHQCKFLTITDVARDSILQYNYNTMITCIVSITTVCGGFVSVSV